MKGAYSLRNRIVTKIYDESTTKVVNELFKEIFSIKPAFKASFETQEDLLTTKRQWMLAFEEENITSIERLRNGFKSLRKSPTPFFPSPGEFLELCKIKPEDIGAPGLDKAYNEAIKNAYPDNTEKKWSHTAVRHAFHKSGPYYLRTGTANETFKVFKKNYLEACEEVAESRNLNQLESPKEYKFTDVQMHWIICYEKCLNHGHRVEDYFPTREIYERAQELHNKWVKSRKNDDKKI